MFKVKIFTLYPEFFPGPFNKGIFGNALHKKIWDINIVNIRDFAEDKHKTVDDTPYGGGSGMVMRADVVANSLDKNLVSEENNTQSIPPESLEQIGAPETSISDSLENTDNQNIEEVVSISPEEAIINAGPVNSVPENQPIEETNVVLEGPQEETLILARPEETQIIDENNIQEQILEETAQLAPEQSLSIGNPSQVFSDAQDTVLAESSISPEVSDISGRPLEEDTQSNQNLQLAEAETNIFTESKPENTNADGNPQEGISLETLGDPQNILIPPEDELTVAGFPEEGQILENIADEPIQIAEIQPLKPTFPAHMWM